MNTQHFISSHKKPDEKGFTLVELMIATAVFSTVLLLATTGVINIGRLYQKGLSTARTQETARSVTDEITRSIQTLGVSEIKRASPVEIEDGGKNGAICLGSNRYTFSTAAQVGDGAIGLWLDEIDSSGECQSAGVNRSGSGRELLGSNMRLTDFDISIDSTDNTKVNIAVGIAYGDDDLLTVYDDGGQFIEGSNWANAQCKPTRFGGSFCAVSRLETFAKKRTFN